MKPNANNLTTSGVNIAPIMAIITHIITTALKILLVYFTAASSPSLDLTSQKSGIKAVPRDVPIAVKITAGIFIATKNASLIDDAP